MGGARAAHGLSQLRAASSACWLVVHLGACVFVYGLWWGRYGADSRLTPTFLSVDSRLTPTFGGRLQLDSNLRRLTPGWLQFRKLTPGWLRLRRADSNLNELEST